MRSGRRSCRVFTALFLVTGIWAAGCEASAPAPGPTAQPVTSHSVAPDSPAGVAVAWAKAVFAGDRAAELARTCPGSRGGNTTSMKLITANVVGVSAGTTTGGGDSYAVTLELAGTGGVQEFTVHVGRINGSYLVC